METKKSVWVGGNPLSKGFTIVEVTIVIVVMGIIASIGIASTLGYQESARDRERANDIDVIARSLDRSYQTQAVSGTSYPSTAATPADIGKIVGDIDLVTAPRQAANSIVIANASGVQTPTVDQYIYQPLNVDGSLCTAVPCVRYKLYYHLEETDIVKVKDSLRQQ